MLFPRFGGTVSISSTGQFFLILIMIAFLGMPVSFAHSVAVLVTPLNVSSFDLQCLPLYDLTVSISSSVHPLLIRS